MSNIRNRIENGFESAAGWFFDHRLKTLLVMLLLSVALISQLPRITIDVSTEGFLHSSDPFLINYNQFRDQFGRDEMIVVAIKSQNVFSREFLTKLKALHEELTDNVPYLDDITSLINARSTRGEADELIVEDLLEEFPETPEKMAEVRERALANPMYRNLLISEDGRFTTLVIKTQTYSGTGADTDVLEGFDEEEPETAEDMNSDTSDAPKQYLTDAENSEAVYKVEQIAAKYAGPDFEIDIAGSASVTHFMKHAMMTDMRRFVAMATLTVAIFLFVMFRRIIGVVLPLVVVVLALLGTVGLMAATGVPIKLPTQILPSFLLAVSVGYSVHILALFFYRLRSSRDKRDAVVYAVGHSGLAVLMTAATTAGGLFSFSTSELAPIADLGRFAGFGVLLAMIYTIVMLPAILAMVPVKLKKREQDAARVTLTDRLMTSVAAISTGRPIIILIISGLLLISSIFGIMKIRYSHDILRWFPRDNSIRIATEKIDKNLRGSVNLEIIIDTGKENGLYDPALLTRLDKTATYMETLNFGKVFVGKAWSLPTILKETNRALNENRVEFYTIPKDRLLVAQELLLFENSGSDDLEDVIDSRFSKVRLTAKVPFEDAVAYDLFLTQIRTYFQQNYSEFNITVTGMTALLSRTIGAAIHSMARSYFYALVVITALMIILIGRLRIGLLSMIPNLTPIMLTLGMIGWFDVPMTLFTMLVGNIAIGLAVDDTIHFMHNFRRYFEQHNDAPRAVSETLHTAGRAMLVTSLVLCMGFFLFMFSSMQNLFHFGLLTGVTILLALLADYFLAPALMVVVHGQNKRKPVAVAQQ